MNNFIFVSAKEAYERELMLPPISLAEYTRRAKSNATCEVCGQEPAWKMANTGLCFSCTTGEADASEDYELL